MVVFPNCKINLGLYITEKRKDGFHNIETVFVPVPLYDILEVVEASDGKTEFSCSGIPVPGDTKNNLCMQAFHLLSGEFALPSVKIHLHKIVPIGAGLGGGSSDAAFALKLFNEQFALGLSTEQLATYTRHLGADCTFFLCNRPVKATGKGDQFSEINLTLKGYLLVIIKPDIHVDTAMAYASIAPKQPVDTIEKILELPIEQWKHHLFNDFEAGIFEKFPTIKWLKEKLYDVGAVYASMSGSGSAVYGIFEKPVDISAEFKDYFFWQGAVE